MGNLFIVNVSVVIFNKQGEILLGHRGSDEDVFPNLWGIPGGKIDSDDKSMEEGLKREVKEEVGIEIKGMKLISNNIRRKSDGQCVLFLVYKATIASGIPSPLEDTVEVRWFPFEGIAASDLTPFTYDIISKAVNYTRKKAK